MDFSCFAAAAFAECQSHLARNEITENFKNMQMHAKTYKKKHKKYVQIKAPIENLQTAKCNQLQQTAIDTKNT